MNGFAWDACCLHNLIATDRAVEILAALHSQSGEQIVSSYVCDLVRKTEVLQLRPLPESEDDTPVDAAPLLDALFESGHLNETVLTPTETSLFIQNAVVLDDGEAATIAIAETRGLEVVTDDKAALRFLHGRGYMALTTPEWIRYWEQQTKPSQEILTEVLRRLDLSGHYTPPRKHDLFTWWHNNRHK